MGWRPTMVMAGFWLLWCSGCALEPGLPWARLAIEVRVHFDPSLGVTPTKPGAPIALESAQGERFVFDSVAVELEQVLVKMPDPQEATSQGTNASSKADKSMDSRDQDFDPSHPPAGYTTCHNGHCHGVDGSLVTYAEVAERLKSAPSANANPSLLVHWPAATAAWVAATPPGTTIAVGACEPSCALPRGALTELQVHLAAIQIVGRVFGPGLPSQGAPLAVELREDTILATPIAVVFDRGRPPIARLVVRVELPRTLFDTVRLADHVQAGAVHLPDAATQALRRQVQQDAGLTVSVSRAWP